MRDAQVVFQDPYSSLSPRMTVHDVVAEPLRAQGRMSGRELEDAYRRRCSRWWASARSTCGGGRTSSAAASASASPSRGPWRWSPSCSILDEPTSALDVSVQARILVLLEELQQRLELAYLFIAHDLAVVEAVADRVAVMYLGQIVETGSNADVLRAPRHPYTLALLASVPSPDPEERSEMQVIRGEVPSAVHVPPRAAASTRAVPFRMEVCDRVWPAPHSFTADRLVACHLPDDFELGAAGQPRSAGGEQRTKSDAP